jgi:hypothetical protein
MLRAETTPAPSLAVNPFVYDAHGGDLYEQEIAK